MVDASQPKAPIFLDRDGLLPAPGLLAELDRPGLARTVTVFGQDAWLVTRAEDVRTVYGDAALFTTSDSVPIFRNDDPDRADLPGALLFMDPPEHTEMRSMLTASFTTRALARLKPRITAIVDEHLDARVAEGSPADLVATFSRARTGTGHLRAARGSRGRPQRIPARRGQELRLHPQRGRSGSG